MRSWLEARTVDDVSSALAQVRPDLAGLPVVLHDGWVETGNALWARSSAFVGGDWVVKYAWTEPAAVKLEREIHTLRALAGAESRPPVRAVATWSSDPVLLVSPFVAGVPVLGSDIATLEPTQLQHLADEFAQVLAALHDPSARAALVQAGVDLPEPTPQADTAALRDRFCPLVDSGRRAVVAGWCDWADGVLEDTRSEQVVLHGDFHGYNVVVDADQTVQVVLDLEEASRGDYHYDFRYLPAQEVTLGLFLATVAAYERRTGRRVAFDRVTAWHLRTVLGDALWRTEAGVALPGGGTPEQWIDELATRMTALDIDTR